jgi:hypothetical protein
MQDAVLLLMMGALGGLLWVQLQRRRSPLVPAPRPHGARRAAASAAQAAPSVAVSAPVPSDHPAAPPPSAAAEPEEETAERENDADRRRHRRLGLDQAILVAPFAEREIMAQCLDVSQGGMRLRTAGLPLREGDLVRVTFNVSGESVLALGRVLRTTPLDAVANEISLEFARIDPWGQRLLEQALAGEK